MMAEDYQIYLKDQEEDGIFEPQYRDMGKKWSYKYCNFLKNNLLKDFDYKKSEVLDIGCREFFTYNYFMENFGNPVTGIDVGSEGLRFTAMEGKPAIYCDAHVLTETFGPEKFDLIISFHAFEHMYDLPKVLKECAKTLKPEGYLYFAVPVPVRNERRGHWYDILSVDDMNKMCEKSGFKIKFSKLFPKGIFRNEQEMLGLVQKCPGI